MSNLLEGFIIIKMGLYTPYMSLHRYQTFLNVRKQGQSIAGTRLFADALVVLTRQSRPVSPRQTPTDTYCLTRLTHGPWAQHGFNP